MHIARRAMAAAIGWSLRERVLRALLILPGYRTVLGGSLAKAHRPALVRPLTHTDANPIDHTLSAHV